MGANERPRIFTADQVSFLTKRALDKAEVANVTFKPPTRHRRRDSRIHLTGSQQAAGAKVLQYYNVFKRKECLAGFRVRPVLLVGSSGAGKTTLLRALCSHVRPRQAYKILAASAWIIQGATKAPQTSDSILDFVRANSERGGWIIVDELDKLSTTSMHYESAWWKEALQENMQLVEGRVENWANWMHRDIEAFRERFFVVGAGTFQHLFRTPKRVPTFASADQPILGADAIDFRRLLERGFISEEWLARWAECIVINPPSHSDFLEQIGRICAEAKLHLSADEKDSLAREAVLSGKGIRFLQDFAAKIILSRVPAVRMPASVTIKPAAEPTKSWATDDGDGGE